MKFYVENYIMSMNKDLNKVCETTVYYELNASSLSRSGYCNSFVMVTPYSVNADKSRIPLHASLPKHGLGQRLLSLADDS